MPAPHTPRHPAWRRWALAALAGLTLASALGVLLAPVVADDPVVSWPRAGQPPRSTVLPLVPYRPLQLDATVPCTTLAALDASGGGDALRTMPDDVTVPPRPGLTVAVSGGTVSIAASGRTLLAEPLPPGGCGYRVAADAGGVRVMRDGSVLSAAPGLLPPQVAQLATDAQGMPAARGLAVTLHTDARYESSPTVAKTVLLLVHGAALLALLVLGWRAWRGSGSGWVRPRLCRADAVVVAVSAVWVVLSPVNFDDAWYVLMARGATDSGAVGNAIYMFNTTENPFVAGQYALALWGWLGQSLLAEGAWGLAWMRLLPLLYGLLVWIILRFALVSGNASYSSHSHSPREEAWALAVAHMLWWLPYGMTLRPEPLIVVFAAATLLLAELARRTRSVGALAAATAAAALGVSVSPSGLAALAPLVLALPWLWRWLRAARWADRVAAGLTLLAAGTALIPVGFADATFGNVLEATAVHQWYYVTFAWHEELVHYETLLTLPDSSQWARRAPVLLTLAVIGMVALGLLRRRGEPAGPLRGLMLRSAVVSGVGLALLSFTPTKWVNHFGAVEAVPTVLLATALLQSPLGARTPSRLLIPAAGTALLVWAVSVSYAGPNFWRPYSDRGQPFGDHLVDHVTPSRVADMAPRLGWLFLSNPAIWIGVALAFAAWMWWRRGRGLAPDRGLLLVSSVSIVVLTLVVFTWAPARQHPGWTVARSVVDAARGQPCGLAHHVRVLGSPRIQPGPPVGAAVRQGRWQPVTALTRGRPVYADQVSATLWPCVNQVGVEHGIAAAPAVLLLADENFRRTFLDLAFRIRQGGTMVQADRTSTSLRVPSRLVSSGPPALPWGRVELLVYDHPVGMVDLDVRQQQRWGWTRLPTLAREDYTGYRSGSDPRNRTR